MNPLSVCFPLPRFDPGGLERVQMHIAAGLVKAAIQAEMVTPRVDPQARSLIKPEVVVHTLGGGRIEFVVRLILWLRKTKPDVIIASANDIGCIAIMLRRLFWRDSRVIWTQHLSISGPLRSSKGLRRVRLMFEMWLMRRLVKRADAVVAVSRSVASDIKCLIDTNLHIWVIHNPAISEDFEQRSQEEIGWLWPDYVVPTVVFVGRLVQVKRIDLLLHAFARCMQTMPARLLIIGDGSEAGMARKLAMELHLGNTCKFAGHCDNPLPWIRRSELLVLCSDSEGFGLVLVEAMACGTQVVATDCPHGPAELLSGGRYGRLVPVGDADALATAMLASLKLPFAAVDDLKARAAEFSVERAVAKYVDMLGNLDGREH